MDGQVRELRACRLRHLHLHLEEPMQGIGRIFPSAARKPPKKSNILRLTYFASRNIIGVMISSFKDKDTRALYETGACRRFSAIVRVALRKLDMIAAATRVETLRVPPGNRLEALSGDRAGQWSIRINDQWRVCFKWNGSNAEDVEIVDYH